MINRNTLMSLGAAIATSRLARTLSNLEANDILGTIGLERHRSRTWETFAVFSVGALAGAGAALLLAPTSGREARQRLSGQIDRLATAANAAVEDVKNEAPALLSRVASNQPGTPNPTENHRRHG